MIRIPTLPEETKDYLFDELLEHYENNHIREAVSNIKGIINRHIIFEKSFRYKGENVTVQFKIPIEDELFNNGELIHYIYPRDYLQYISFKY